MFKNSKCPNAICHLENAIDRFFPSGKITSARLAESWDVIARDVEEEYFECEGHG